MTREPKFLKRLYRKYIPGQANKYWFTFSVPIGTAKNQVKLILSWKPLPWNINNMTKTYFVLVD